MEAGGKLRFRTVEVANCAEDPDLVQISGEVSGLELSQAVSTLGRGGWAVTTMAGGTVAVAHTGNAMLILHAQGFFSLSRVESREQGIELLNGLPGWLGE